MMYGGKKFVWTNIFVGETLVDYVIARGKRKKKKEKNRRDGNKNVSTNEATIEKEGVHTLVISQGVTGRWKEVHRENLEE